jgi:hypothetical protein
VIAHLVFSAMGEYLLARRLGVSAAGAFLAGGAWMSSGPLLSTVNMWNHFAGATWLPWVLLLARRAGDTLAPRDAVWWGGALAAQAMTGSPDSSAMAALCSVGCVLARLRAPLRANLRPLGIAALAAALTAGPGGHPMAAHGGASPRLTADEPAGERAHGVGRSRRRRWRRWPFRSSSRG